MKTDKTKKSSDNFWKDLVYTKGKLDEKKVLNELSDYYFMLEEVPKVYCAVTNYSLSKPNYYASEVISMFEDLYLDKGITHDDVQDMIKGCDTLKELKKELKEYFV